MKLDEAQRQELVKVFRRLETTSTEMVAFVERMLDTAQREMVERAVEHVPHVKWDRSGQTYDIGCRCEGDLENHIWADHLRSALLPDTPAEKEAPTVPTVCGLSQEDYDNLVRDAMRWRKQSIDAERVVQPSDAAERETAARIDELTKAQSALTEYSALNFADWARRRYAELRKEYDSEREPHEIRMSVVLYRSLERLSTAIESCARIGFQESSPTKNEHHAAIWKDLNEAQKDAKLKLKMLNDTALRSTERKA